MRKPTVFLTATLHGYALAVAVVLLAALSLPAVGLRVEPDGAGFQARLADGSTVKLAPGATITVATAGGRMQQRAAELVADFTPAGSFGDVRRWFGERDTLAALARSGASATLPGGEVVRLAPRPRRLADIPQDSWLLLLQGGILVLLGAWLAAMRPGDPGARLFALSCAGMTVASLSGALFDARELAANGTLLHALHIFNLAGSNVGTAALLAVFLCQPRPHVRFHEALAFVAVAGLVGALVGLGLLPLGAFYLGLLGFAVGFPAVLTVQWRSSRGDPAARASIRWVGLTTLLGTGQIALAMALPVLFGTAPLAGDGMTILPLAIVYASIAFGIGRARLFELDRWTYRVMLGTVAIAGVLLLDGVLVALLRLDRPVALLLSLAAIGYLYMPVRSRLWRWLVEDEGPGDHEKFQLATAIAFASSPAARREDWRRLLCRLFDPLSLEPADAPIAVAAASDDGRDLFVPATADEVTLRLRFRSGGRRLFGPDQARLAEEMVTLMRRADLARAEYARGVGEERQRIARDLHDDVCATLLTSLHRDEVGRVHADVRSAMADIRTMIGGLTGQRVALARAIADLRFESSERLAAGGVELAWPIPDQGYPALLLDYPVYRTLVSTVREAISNILKHANAARATVTIRADDSGVRIIIADDGARAWCPEAVSRGHGLANMRTRLAQIGGGAEITRDGGMTSVALILPFAGAPSSAPSRVPGVPAATVTH